MEEIDSGSDSDTSLNSMKFLLTTSLLIDLSDYVSLSFLVCILYSSISSCGVTDHIFRYAVFFQYPQIRYFRNSTVLGDLSGLDLPVLGNRGLCCGS